MSNLKEKKQEEDVKILLCNPDSTIPKSKKSKCDYCGVDVYYCSNQKHDKKMCIKCFNKKPYKKYDIKFTRGFIEKLKKLTRKKYNAS